MNAIVWKKERQREMRKGREENDWFWKRKKII
jgi:hypothetical protein